MTRSYLPFLDWLKALGMTVIVYGHVTGSWPLVLLPPINSKQLGVALFMFVTGYSLAGERGDRWKIVFKRLFEICVLGILVAAVVSAMALATGNRPQLSNYYPFLGGVNVLMDHFPANPTTWYVGTYLHLIVVWAVALRRLRVTTALLVAVLIVEIVIRAVLMQWAGNYIAYMLLPNWATAFLLGVWYGQQQRTSTSLSGLSALAVLIAFFAVWVPISHRLPLDDSFPFMRPLSGSMLGLIGVSALVSMLYVGVTWLTFAVTSRSQAPAAVRFIARNTLIVFLAHMPVYYLLVSEFAARIPNRSLRATLFMIICLPGLALVSEGVRYLIRPRELRLSVAARLWPKHV